MTTSLIQPATGDIVRDAPAHRVYTREFWQRAWTLQEHLYCDRFVETAAPAAASAVLYWDYGSKIQAGETEFADVEPLDLVGHYVKIEVDTTEDTPRKWYGRIPVSAPQRGGNSQTFTGLQTLSAAGLDHLLNRTPIVTSFLRNDDNGSQYEIQRGITFNEPNHVGNCGNRSMSPGPDGVYLFSESQASGSATWWTTRTIVEYLLNCHPPLSIYGVATCGPWELSDRAKTCLPDWDKPVVKTHGRSVRDILCQLLDRRRGMAWTLTVDENGAGGTIYLDAFSFLKDPLTLPSGETQAANDVQWDLVPDDVVDMQATVKESDSHVVEQVIVRGDPKRAVISLGDADNTLDADWAASDKTDYDAGPNLTGVDDVDEKEKRLRAYRTDPDLARVYAYFRLPADWDGRVADGLGGTAEVAFPADDRYGTELYYVPGLRFERKLPSEILDIAPTDGEEIELEPFVVFKTETGSPDRYQFGDLLAAGDGIEGEGDGHGRGWSCSLRLQPHAPGVILKVSGSIDSRPAGQHVLASADYTPLSFESAETVDLNWKHAIVTVCLRLDSAVEARYPEDGDVSIEADVVRRVTIDLAGKDLRLDWCTAGAVIGLADGQLQRIGTAQYLRDDRDTLEDIARFVYDWYQTPRQALTIRTGQIYDGLSIGDLIVTLGEGDHETAINSVVTSITHNVKANTTTAQTSFAELDPSILV